jgi:hypothetical protein
MHNCPLCQCACFCDCEDHYQSAPPDCRHECDPTSNRIEDEEEDTSDHDYFE